MIEIALPPDTLLRALRADDAPGIHALIVANRRHLDRWLRWSSAIRTLDDVRELIESFEQKEAAGTGFHLGIHYRDEPAGGVICWNIDRRNRNAEIGYWLGEPYTRCGLASAGAAAATEHLFAVEGLHRVEMMCGTENVRSRAVPERLGFHLDGTRRESHWITDHFADHAIYSMLEDEWRARPGLPLNISHSP